MTERREKTASEGTFSLGSDRMAQDVAPSGEA